MSQPVPRLLAALQSAVNQVTTQAQKVSGELAWPHMTLAPKPARSKVSASALRMDQVIVNYTNAPSSPTSFQ